MPSILSLILRAKVIKPRSVTAPDNITVNAASWLAIVTSLTTGSSVSLGSLAFAKVTLSRTSASASLGSSPAINSKVTEAWPSPALERISLMPAMDLSSFSMGLTSMRSASSGEMPSWIIET